MMRSIADNVARDVGKLSARICDMHLRLIFVALITSLTLSGCAQSAVESKEILASDVTTTRVASDEVPKFSRVIALANGAAEVIDSLGVKEILIGRDIASTEPELAEVPIVTSGHQVVPEKIIELNPDLVVIDSSVGPKQALATLERAGVRIYEIDQAWDLLAISKKIIEISTVLEMPKTGRALIAELKKTEATAAEKVRGAPRVAFLYLRGGNSIYLIGGAGSGADSLLRSIGAIDVGADRFSQPFTSLTSEALIQLNPEVILVMKKGLESVGGVAGLTSLPGIAQTFAGKENQVIAVDDSLLLSFGPRTPSLLTKLAQALNQMKQIQQMEQT